MKTEKGLFENMCSFENANISFHQAAKCRRYGVLYNTVIEWQRHYKAFFRLPHLKNRVFPWLIGKPPQFITGIPHEPLKADIRRTIGDRKVLTITDRIIPRILTHFSFQLQRKEDHIPGLSVCARCPHVLNVLCVIQ